MKTLTVRPVDHNNDTDIRRLADIVESEAAAEAMDEISGMDDEDIVEWVEDSLAAISEKTYTDWEIVYAVTPINDEVNPQRNNALEGFVNFYASREVTDRYHREMKRLNKESASENEIIEVSMAKWPNAPRGQMSLGLCLACVEIDALMAREHKSKNMIVAYIDPENMASIKAFEKAGFQKQGRVYYDLDDDLEGLDIDGVDLYTVNWKALHEFLDRS